MGNDDQISLKIYYILLDCYKIFTKSVKNIVKKQKIYIPTQLSHKLQCEALGGLNILQVKQYFNFTGCPLTNTSFVRGGGLYILELPLFGTSLPICKKPNFFN